MLICACMLFTCSWCKIEKHMLRKYYYRAVVFDELTMIFLCCNVKSTCKLIKSNLNLLIVFSLFFQIQCFAMCQSGCDLIFSCSCPLFSLKIWTQMWSHHAKPIPVTWVHFVLWIHHPAQTHLCFLALDLLMDFHKYCRTPFFTVIAYYN